MTPRFRRSISALLLALPLVTSCQKSDNVFEKRRASEQRRAKATLEAEDEATIEHNAVRDWARIPAESTANVKSALIRPDQRPLFFTGRLRDIDSTAGDAYVVTVDVDAWFPGALRFRLACGRDEAGALLNERIAVQVVGVADILDVRMTQDGALPGFGRRFTATGKCLFVKALGD